MMQIHRIIAESHACLVNLYDIALKKGVPDITEYIELLIEKEELRSQPGFQDRLKHLQEIKLAAECLKKMQYGHGAFPFEEKLKSLDEKGLRLVVNGNELCMKIRKKAWYKRLIETFLTN